MQDRNAQAPKVRSGDEINPVLGTIIKISALVVIAALVVLTTLIIIEFVKLKKKEENVFKDRIHITEEDFIIITTGDNHDDLSDEVREIMNTVDEEGNVYFFFYYSDNIKDVETEIKELVVSRDKQAPIFLVDLNMKSAEDDEGNKLPTLIDYLKGNEYLNPPSSGPEFNTVIQQKEKYPFFLLIFNEQNLNVDEKPFIMLTKAELIKEDLKTLAEAKKED